MIHKTKSGLIEPSNEAMNYNSLNWMNCYSANNNYYTI